MSDAYDVGAWTDLFAASAAASAALTGLLFVAVSINIDQILALDGLPSRALGTLMLLLSVVVVSLIGLIPGQSTTALGVELLLSGLLLGGFALWLIVRSIRPDHERSWVLSRLAAALPGTLPFVVGGVSVLVGWGGGLYWTAGGIVGAIVGASVTAWVLLVEIRR